MNKNFSRRDFLKIGGIGAVGFTILPSMLLKAAASDRLRIAHIGLGGMGNNHMQAFAADPGTNAAPAMSARRSRDISVMNHPSRAPASQLGRTHRRSRSCQYLKELTRNRAGGSLKMGGAPEGDVERIAKAPRE